MSAIQFVIMAGGCLPEMPSILAMSERTPCKDEKDKEMKREVEKVPKIEPESDLLLDLKLGNNEMDHGSKLETNSLDCLKASSQNESKAEIKGYFCKYCNKKFSNSQALGGHQNAHKRERALEKGEKGKKMVDGEKGKNMAAFGHINSILYPFSGMVAGPSHGSFNRALGVQMHSMIHKPYNHWPYRGLGHGYPGWTGQAIMNPTQATMHHDPLRKEDYLAGSGGLQPVPATTGLNGAAAFGMFGSSGYHQGGGSLKNQKCKSCGLDLSLKL